MGGRPADGKVAGGLRRVASGAGSAQDGGSGGSTDDEMCSVPCRVPIADERSPGLSRGRACRGSRRGRGRQVECRLRRRALSCGAELQGRREEFPVFDRARCRWDRGGPDVSGTRAKQADLGAHTRADVGGRKAGRPYSFLDSVGRQCALGASRARRRGRVTGQKWQCNHDTIEVSDCDGSIDRDRQSPTDYDRVFDEPARKLGLQQGRSG